MLAKLVMFENAIGWQHVAINLMHCAQYSDLLPEQTRPYFCSKSVGITHNPQVSINNLYGVKLNAIIV